MPNSHTPAAVALSRRSALKFGSAAAGGVLLAGRVTAGDTSVAERPPRRPRANNLMVCLVIG